jgi:mycothiol synthase
MAKSYHLPAGYTARPFRLDDAEAAAQLSNACAIELTGKPSLAAGEIRSDWQSPHFNSDTDSLAVFTPQGELAGYVEVWDSEPHVHDFVSAEVHPQHRGQGIGTALARWAEQRAQQLLPLAPVGARVVLQQFKSGSDEAAARLLRAQGYEIARHNLRMAIEFDGPPPDPVVPDGLLIRPFIRGQEERALVMAMREEFRDHWGYVESAVEEDYRDWMHWMETNPTCDPSLLFVAVDGDEIAGTSLCQDATAEDPELGWIFGLGVRRPWRRRGLALALLRYSFGVLYRRGKRKVSLGVDAQSLTGATRLYERAGMRLERQYEIYEKELRPGTDLGTQAVE